MQPQLMARNLCKKYGGRTVLDDVTLHVGSGEVVGVLGPNGAGKTTAFKLLLGIESPDAGDVSFGESLNGLPLYRRARLGLGYLPQESTVFGGLTVRENIFGILKTLGDPRSQETTDVLLNRFHLASLAGQKARTLSGGERRKLEFARALCAKPTVLLVDEPFAGVDPLASEEVGHIILELAQQGIGILLTDHSVRNALEICQRVYLLVDGHVVETGTADELKSSTRARELYLGNTFVPSAV